MKKVLLLTAYLCAISLIFQIHAQSGSPAIGVTVAGGNGTGTALNQVMPYSILTDANQHLYVLDQINNRVLKFLPGATLGIVVAGGNGRGAALNQLDSPYGIALDPAGNLYVADFSNRRIVKWTPGASSGIVITETNSNIFPGNVRGVALDAAGNVYALDYYNSRIMKYAPGSNTGVIILNSTSMGTLNQPTTFSDGFFVTPNGNIYITDRFGARVLKWTPGSQYSTVIAGINGNGNTSYQLNSPNGVYVDAAGTVYIADMANARIQKWPAGASEGVTIAGGNGPGLESNQLSRPTNVFVDGNGRVFVADWGNYRVQLFDRKNPPGSSVAGITVAGGDGSITPYGIHVDAAENIYVADPVHNRVVKYTKGSTVGTTVAGGNGQGNAANQLNFPNAVCVDGAGNIYISDRNNSRIQKWAPGAATGITIAGDAFASGDNQFVASDIFIDKQGNLYVCDEAHDRVLKWPPGSVPGTPGTVVARTNSNSLPSGIWIDDSGAVYVSIPDSGFVKKFMQGVVNGTNVAGTGMNGIATTQLNSPRGIYLDADGNLFVADVVNNRIQRWAPGATEGITVAGGNGSGTGATQLSAPNDVFVDANGNIYVSDRNNGRIQKFGDNTGKLAFKYYEGNWQLLPDFNTLTPIKSGYGNNVNLNVRRQGVIDNFAFLWQGFIKIPTPGNYTFETVSDDGSRLYFNTAYSAGATPTVDNNGLHAAQSAIGVVNVAAAGTYPITISYFEKDGGESMQVFWSGPGFSRQPIPDAAFVTGDGSGPDPDIVPPSIPANLQVLSKTATSVSLDWTDATDNIKVTAYDVYVNGIKKYTVTDSKVNADSLLQNTNYNFTIKALDLAGNSSAFSEAISVTTSNAPAGLTYKYYQGIWNTLPDFSSLTPVKTGTSANVDISVRNRSDNFALVWEGYINIATPGTYTFETVSDDGSKFYFNSLYNPAAAVATVNNDGLHAPTSATGNVYIASAGSYPVTVTYFEKDGGEQMELYWTGPGIARQLVPNAVFTQIPAGPPPSAGPANLSYKYYEGSFNLVPYFPQLTPVKTGTSSNFDLGVRRAGVDDGFAITWDGFIKVPAAGNYSFEVISDDGAILYFNGQPLVNNDATHPPISVTENVYIPAPGVYPIRLDYFENYGAESLQVFWSGPGFGRQQIPDTAFVANISPLPTGLNYQYYEGNFNVLPDFTTLVPVKTGVTPNININLRNPGINDHFAFVWQGYINLPTAGIYTFETVSDDGSKVYFNSPYSYAGSGLVDNNGLHAATSKTGTINVPAAGRYPITVTFFDKDGGEAMELYMTGPGIPRQLVPDAAFTTTNAMSGIEILGNRLNTSQAKIADANSSANIKVYPNPFTESFTVDYYNSGLANKKVEIGIFDLNGRLIYNVQPANLVAGYNKWRINVGNNKLALGIYTAQVKINGVPVKAIKVLKSR